MSGFKWSPSGFKAITLNHSALLLCIKNRKWLYSILISEIRFLKREGEKIQVAVLCPEPVQTNHKSWDLLSHVAIVATMIDGLDCGRLPAKHTTGIVISIATPQIKILILSLILKSCMTLGESFNLSLQMRKLRLCTLI